MLFLFLWVVLGILILAGSWCGGALLAEGEPIGFLAVIAAVGMSFLFASAFTEPVTYCEPGTLDLEAGTHEVTVECTEYESTWDAEVNN